MIVHRTRFLTQGEVWFDEEPGNISSVDWIVYYRRSQSVPRGKWSYTYTSAIDLNRSVEQLKAQLNTDTAYKIRRACERDKIRCECCDAADPEVLNQFETMYNSFAKLKGLLPLERRRIASMAAADRLDMSVAKDADGNVLVYHGNYRVAHRATSLYTVSLYRATPDGALRNLISRANRFLVWSDLLRYKAQGLKCFDFGGWHTGTDPARLKINRFKEGFGGEIIREYECEQIVSFRGWVVLKVAALLNWAKRAPARLRSGQQPEKLGSSNPVAQAHSPNSSPEAGTPALRVIVLAK
jgi:hypothetical protein